MSTDIRPDDPDDLQNFLELYCHDQIEQLAMTDERSLVVSYRDLGKDPNMREFYEAIPDQLDEVRDALHGALQQYPTQGVSMADVSVRIGDVPEYERDDPSTAWQADVGEFVAIEGQVSKVTGVKKEPQQVHYECQMCSATTPGVLNNGEYDEPPECEMCERRGPFDIDWDRSEFRPYQLVRLQQPPEEAAGDNGEHIDVEVRDDLVNDALAGDRVTLSGTMELEAADDGLFEDYVRGQAVDHQEQDYEEINIDEHREEIQKLADGEYGDPYELLVDSIAPKIRGYDTIKEAVALQLFGGVRSEYPEGGYDRGDIHMLLLGDPGCGKSSILRAVEELAPRSVYASGKGATEAGMTASVVSDDFGDAAFSLEAGALVTANKGIACVDELDKVPEEVRSSLHDALESQRVNINKAGINANLPAQTAMLAAGNPKYGRFDDMEPIYEQIELGPTLLSRFDLLWMVDDEPEEDRDRDIASHMVRARQTANLYTSDAQVEEDALDAIQPAIPSDLLRAYIAHAKRAVTPRLEDDDVAEELVDSFTDLRQVNGDNGPVPVTFRKLEGIQRLAEASARVRLSNTVEREDVERARKLVGKSMKQLQQNEDEQMDADVIEAGTSMPQKRRMELLVDVVQEIAREHENGAPEGKVLDAMADEGVERERVKKDLTGLKARGEVYEPSAGCLRTS
jgi:replicative DNA helicase Mcm